MTDDPSVLDLPLERIKPRAQQDIRELNVVHTIDMAETIAAAGLLEPIVLDSRFRLLAGLHRYAAWQLLTAVSKMDPEQLAKGIQALAGSIFGKQEVNDQQITRIRELNTTAFLSHHAGGRIPCRVMPFDAEKDAKRALEVEVAENEKRRDFSRAEIEKLVERLKDRGFTEVTGRPQPGVRPLNPMLQVILGKSRRQVSRILNSSPKETATVVPPQSYLPQLARVIGRALPELKASRNAQWRAAALYFEKGQQMIQGLITT